MSRAPLKAWYLPPALEADLETTVQRFGPPHDAVELALPIVQPSDVPWWIDSLVEAGRGILGPRPVRAIVRPLERVASRFLDPRDRARREAIDALARAGRFGAAEVARALDDAFEPLAGGGMARWISAELGSPAVLDRVAPRREGPARRAHGPEWMLQIYAGNVPSIPIWPMLAALLLRAAVLAKTSSREPLLPPLLARTIAEVDADLGRCLAVVWWKGGASDLDRIMIQRAPAVLAFGGDAAVAEIARAARPGARVVLHGPKVSAACVARDALTPEGARDAARRAASDAALYDQRGCLSPHAIYVERGGRVSPEEFAMLLGEELATAGPAPPAARPPEEGARVRLYRTQAEFEAAAGAGAAGAGAAGVIAPERGLDWTVVVESGARFEPGPAHRVVRVHAVGRIDEAVEALRPHARFLEAVALEAGGARRARLAAALASLGVPRVAALGRLQRPGPLGAHGGVGFLAPFVTWTTVDPVRKTAGPGIRPGPGTGSKAGRTGSKAGPSPARRASASRSSGRGSRPGARAARHSR